MLQISNLSFTYQSQPLFQNFNLTLSSPEIVAIIGDNGTGKTTLLRLIAGELHPDEGSISTRGEIGFLKQTAEETATRAAEESSEKTSKNLSNKSGGERTQIRLAELFRQNPHILLLDEPTNNLDRESQTWLIRNLQRYHGLALIVSHDRDFLQKVAQKIIYLHDGEIEVFPGNYIDFCERQAQLQHEKSQNYERSQREKQKLERQLKIAHDRAHKSNRRSYDKINDESRLRYNGQRMAAQNSAGKILRSTESRLEQIKAVEKPLERKTYSAALSADFLHDKKLLEARNLTKSFSQKKLFENLNFEIRTGERIRICGRNGSGKSTLFQILLGNMSADRGEVWLAPNFKIGYISQNITDLNPNKSFLAQCKISGQSSAINQSEIFRAASTMDFAPHDLTRPTRELSRGQLTKLLILELILYPLDLVIIDEITNHLDIRARENIESALENYRGAILAATHDETFARKLKFTKELSLPYHN